MAKQKLSTYEKELRKELRKEEKIRSDRELIENNINLIKVLYLIFDGQVLNMDLEEFCIKYGVYKDENQYNVAIDKLMKGKIIKKKTLVNTTNTVIVAKAPVLNYFGINDSIEYKTLTVRRNVYKLYIIKKLLKKITLEDRTMDEIVGYLRGKTNLLVNRNDAKSNYNFYENHINLSEIGKYKRDLALYKQYLYLSKLPNIEVEKVKEPKLVSIEDEEKYNSEDIIKHKLKYCVKEDDSITLQTLRDRGIYTSVRNGEFKFFITDEVNDISYSSLIKKMVLAINTFHQQVKEDDLKKLHEVRFAIVVRSEIEENKVKRNFVTKVGKKKRKNSEEVTTNNLLESLNKELKKLEHGRLFNYKFIEKTEENDGFIFQNTIKPNKDDNAVGGYSAEDDFYNIVINVLNANLEDRISMHKRVEKLVESNIKKQEKLLKEKLRKEIEEELRTEIMKEFEMNITEDI